MKKLLFNVVGMLILSICVLSSCSKGDDEEVTTPITKEEAVGDWTIIGAPVINVTIQGQAAYQEEISTDLAELFKAGDKYVFKDDLSCTVTRGNSTSQYPNKYQIEGEYIIFDGYIKFKTNTSESKDKITFAAGNDEIRNIVKEKLQEHKGGELGGVTITDTTIGIICKTVSGKLEFVLQKVVTNS